jgi:hypothetical protein
MVDGGLARPVDWLRTKFFVFAFIAAMALYVLYHNERFLINPTNPIWPHLAGQSLQVNGRAGSERI